MADEKKSRNVTSTQEKPPEPEVTTTDLPTPEQESVEAQPEAVPVFTEGNPSSEEVIQSEQVEPEIVVKFSLDEFVTGRRLSPWEIGVMSRAGSYSRPLEEWASLFEKLLGGKA